MKEAGEPVAARGPSYRPCTLQGEGSIFRRRRKAAAARAIGLDLSQLGGNGQSPAIVRPVLALGDHEAGAEEAEVSPLKRRVEVGSAWEWSVPALITGSRGEHGQVG